MSTLNDKVVIVTGGSSGIGRATALRFAEQGAKVVMTGRHDMSLKETAGLHSDIVGVVANAATPDDAARTVAKAVDTWGRLDVLVNNAGAGANLPLTDATAERITQIFAVNVVGPSLLAHGVRVNAVAPGPTQSGALTGMMGLSSQEAMLIEEQERERIPLKRRGNPDDVARWIVQLADPVSEWVTGQVIAVDGGLGVT